MVICSAHQAHTVKTGSNGVTSCDDATDVKSNKKDATAGDMENIMMQIYNLGMSTNPTDVGPSPGPSSAGNQGGPDGGSLVAQHFSAIQQAQLVGYNIIGTVIGSMNHIFTIYSEKVHKAISQGQGDAITVYNACLASAWMPWLKGNCEKQKVDASVTMSATLAGIAMTLMWLPLALFVLTSLFVAGIQFAFFVPFMPYILFWAGKVTWLLLVIEALVAAPIMALGIVWPDGHDLWGAAEPGVKMIVQVILFPALLVIGLLVGMCLSYVVIHFSAQGFHAVGASVLDFVPIAGSGGGYTGTASVSMVQGVVACFMVMLYGTFIVMAFQQCFSAIHVIPERVLLWVGVQGFKFGEQQLNEMKQQSVQNAKEGGQAGGQTLTQGTQALQGQGKALGEGNIQTGDAAAKPAISTAEFIQSSVMSVGKAGMAGAMM